MATVVSKQKSIGPHLALITVQILFGIWPIVGKIALRSLPSSGLVAFRTVGAAIAFLLVGRLVTGARRVERKDLPRLAFYSLLGVAGNQLLFVKGLSMTTAINTTLLSTAIPVFALVISILFGFDRLSIRKIFGIMLAAFGVLYLLWPERNFTSQTALGNLLIIANSFCYGAYIAISRDMVEKYGALTVITWIFVFGAIMTVPVGAVSIATGPAIHVSTPLVGAVVFIILFPTVLAYYLNAWALGRTVPSVVAVYTYLQPLFAFTLAPLILGERLSFRTLISSLLILAGVLTVAKRRRVTLVVDLAQSKKVVDA